MVRCLVVVLGLLLASCSAGQASRTELVLVADTDIPTLDRIEFLVEGEGKMLEPATSEVSKEKPAPRSLGLVYTKGSLGPLTLTAKGYVGDKLLVSRFARVSFVKGKTLVVPLHLVASCIDFDCAKAANTCTERGCESASLKGSMLEAWDESLPELPKPAREGGVSPGDGAMSLPDGSTGRLDAAIEAGTDGAQPLPDGSVPPPDSSVPPPDSSVPPPDSSVPPVDAGPTCAPNFDDCDPATPGCETNLLEDDDNCKMCGRACPTGFSCNAAKCTKNP